MNQPKRLIIRTDITDWRDEFLQEEREVTKIENHRRILQQLRVTDVWPIQKWEKALRDFASEFGIGREEIKKGVNSLIGDLITRTVNSEALVSEADLIEAFTGYRDARRLIPQQVLEFSQRQLDDFFESRLELKHEPVRRQVLDEISRAIAEHRALIILSGLGGCGKTTALWQWVKELRETSPSSNGAFTEVWIASNIPRFWIAEIICKWGNIAGRQDRRMEEPERVLERLKLANPDILPPIMHLGLDGLDEEINSDQRYIIRDVLRWFWKEEKLSYTEDRSPRAILLVTCRDEEELTQKWLQLSGSGFSYQGELPRAIVVDSFTSEELCEAFKLINLSDEIYQRIESTLGLSRFINSHELLSSRTDPTFIHSTNEQILVSLKHPAMWRSFLELTNKDQLDALEGQPRAIQQLAKVFVNWFCEKTKIRNPERASKCLPNALVEIGYRCHINDHSRQSRIKDWIEPCKACGLSESDANFIYDEALSAGVIQKDDLNYWRWQHKWVVGYLATLKRINN